MSIRAIIEQLIRETRPISSSIGEETHLYVDLGFDSLAFVALLLEVEREFSIRFAIAEMERCLVVGGLVDLVREKVGVT